MIQIFEMKHGIVELMKQNLELGRKQSRELTKWPELMQFSPDFEKYEVAERAGTLLVLVAVENGRLLGYSVNIIGAHLHYKDSVASFNDLLYLDPEYRGSGLGAELMDHTKAAAKERGTLIQTWHAKPNTTLNRILAESPTAEMLEISYTEKL